MFTLASAAAPAGKGSATIVANQLVFDPGADFDHLAAGVTETVVVSYTMTDDHGASSSSTLTIIVTGTNDGATITPVAGGDTSVIEAGGVANASIGDANASGQVTVSDADDGQAIFQVPPSLNGTYGTFTFDATNGQWTYTLDNSRAATQALNVGSAVTDTLTVTSSDGTASQNIVVNVTGANDAAVISGDEHRLGQPRNAVANTATGDLDSTDVDNPNDSWTVVASAAASANGYGSYTIDASGHWTYTLDNANPAVNALNAGGTLSDTFTVTTVDGTSQVVTVTINGANDAAVITGASTGSVIEAGGVANGLRNDRDRRSQLDRRRQSRRQLDRGGERGGVGQRLRQLHDRCERALDLHARQRQRRRSTR